MKYFKKKVRGFGMNLLNEGLVPYNFCAFVLNFATSMIAGLS